MSVPIVFISSFLAPHEFERLKQAFAGEVAFAYDPALMPAPRYVADHTGSPDFVREPQQEQRWQTMVAEAEIAFDFPYKHRHPRDYAPNLKWIQTTSAGVGQAVMKMGIQADDLIITTASGVHARPLTEFVFMVLLMASKNYPLMKQQQEARHWERYCGIDLAGKTLAIIGPGKIGQDVAHIARAFGMSPVAMARTNNPERAAQMGMDTLYQRSELHQMLAGADAVVLCAPHTPDTENIMDRDAFNAMKQGAVFVNIGRGELVDEEALLENLDDGTISLAGLDVFRTEPLPPESPFWTHPNVVVSPHSASTTTSENERILAIFTQNLRCYLNGDLADMANILDIERMY